MTRSIAVAVIASMPILVTVAAPLHDTQSGRSAVVSHLAQRDPLVMPAPSESEWSVLKAIYQHGGNMPLWLDARGSVTGLAFDAVDLFERAADDGLRAEDYGAGALRSMIECASLPASLPQRAALDVNLTASLMRFLTDLRVGRVASRALGFDLPSVSFDTRAAVVAAIGSRELAAAVRAATPPLAEYGRLRGALARLRESDHRNPGALPLIRLPRAGERYPEVGLLRAKLILLGDLAAPDAPAADETLPPSLVAALVRFQRRHGLAPDGILGTDTLAALNVPLRERIAQMELAMERLRWLPDMRGDRTIFVNIAAYRLWMWDGLDPAGAAGESMAIVAGTRRTPTPVFESWLDAVLFRPAWVVPRSIVAAEMLPAMARDGRYLSTHRLEVIDPAGRVVAPPLSADQLRDLRAGRLQLRQLPGPANALGLIKFQFANDYGVYLHGTPSISLFERSSRAFSHGCVRVAAPDALAQWVLNDAERWSPSAIAAAMHGPASKRVDVRERVRLLVFYATAYVPPGTTEPHFAADVYGHDARLHDALNRLRGTHVDPGGRVEERPAQPGRRPSS